VTIRIHLTPEDLAETRFAFSPLWEAAQSVEALENPGKYVFHLPWIDRARGAVGDLDLEPLTVLLSYPPIGYRVDFVTPPPEGPYPVFEDELERIRATPHDVVRREIETMYPGDHRPAAAQAFLDEPDAALRRLTDALQAYWDTTLAEHWPRLRALLEGDLLYRAKRLALEGAQGLFGDLHPAVTWKDGVLSVDKRAEEDVEPGGRGLLLVPVAFACPKCTVTTDPPWQPTLTYTPRAIATLWDADGPSGEGVLDELVGETRAAILRALEIPMTTTEVASRLGVTPGAVSQQLAVLRRAGVVDAHRSGRGVYSELTPLGESLVSLLDA
jgi:DNA-binding transcriptional ArsR family regulator